MSELHEVVLDKRAAAYMREHLTDINVLCSELLAVLDTEPGEIFTLCPVGTPIEKLYLFTSGGLLRENLDFSSLSEILCVRHIDAMERICRAKAIS